MLEGQRDQSEHERARPWGLRGIEKIAWRETEWRQLARGYIAPARSQVTRRVAQHIRHLEGFPETHALGTPLGDVPAGQAPAMGDVQRGPERPHASGHEVRVVIQLLERVERGEAFGVFAGKAREVDDHARGQRLHDRAHRGPVEFGQRPQSRDRLVDALEQPALGVVRLMRGARPNQRGHLRRRARAT